MDLLEPPAEWSAAVEEANWIAERLGPFAADVSSVVPAGFEAYARVLHPAEEPTRGHRLVRWREIASWSGIALRPDAQFHTVAMPPAAPADPPPWSGQGPREGGLYPPDAAVLTGVLRDATTAPEGCFFGLWAGYGIAVNLPLVRLPEREYLLYTGPVEALTAPVASAHGQTANLAWPPDHAWCVVSEIDLCWTYVAGSRALVERLLAERLLADDRLEVLPAAPDEPLTRIEPFVADLVEPAVTELLAGAHTLVTTSQGTVEAWLERPDRRGPGALRTRLRPATGWRGTGGGLLGSRDEEGLRRELRARLASAVVSLVGG